MSKDQRSAEEIARKLCQRIDDGEFDYRCASGSSLESVLTAALTEARAEGRREGRASECREIEVWAERIAHDAEGHALRLETENESEQAAARIFRYHNEAVQYRSFAASIRARAAELRQKGEGE